MRRKIAGLLLAAVLTGAATGTDSLTAVSDNYPNLSPDGRQLAFQSTRGGSWAIWIADANGANPRRLYDGAGAGKDPVNPVWSPDGRQIAFAMRPNDATIDEESDVYAMDADGTNVRRLTRAVGDDAHPHWSADGKRIFFNSGRATQGQPEPRSAWSEIYSMASDGSDLRKHSDCQSTCTYPTPSPDGRSVVYRRVTRTAGQNWDWSASARNSEVFVGSLDGSRTVNVSNSPAFDGWPTWSPDSRWVVFASNRDKAITGQIYAVRPDGTGLRRLTQGDWSRAQPSFSRAGDRIYSSEGIEAVNFELYHIASFAFDGQPVE